MTDDIQEYAKTLPLLSLAQGDDEDDTRMLQSMGVEAVNYIGSMPWCLAVKEAHFGTGIGRVVAAYLMHVDPRPPADEWVWVICGDLPSAYLVVDRSPTAEGALATYCELMSDWVEAVRSGEGIESAFPVGAPPTVENADSLSSRIDFIRRELLGRREGTR